MTSILIVEDERHLAEGLRFNLEAEGYRVRVAQNGETALALLLAQPESFAAVLLDCMLPGKDGFAVASELRAAGKFVPILMLTAMGRPEDVLRGFEAGADDYLPKPFELEILLARLRGLLRRREWLHRERSTEQTSRTSNSKVELEDEEPAKPFAFSGKVFDFEQLELRTASGVVRLTLMEAQLLRYLIRHAERAVSRKAMLEDVWGLHEETDTRAIDNFIVRLRKYIEDEPTKPKHLLTVRGVGYRFSSEAI
jgi:DNA-binding response OmpR family regulator